MAAGGRIQGFVAGVLSLRQAAGTSARLDVVGIHETHADFVWRSLQRLGVRPADLEDALQEVFIVVHRRLDTFDGSSRLSTWLFGISIRVAAAMRRKAHLRREHPTPDVVDAADDESSDPESRAIAREDRGRLEEALDALA